MTLASRSPHPFSFLCWVSPKYQGAARALLCGHPLDLRWTRVLNIMPAQMTPTCISSPDLVSAPAFGCSCPLDSAARRSDRHFLSNEFRAKLYFLFFPSVGPVPFASFPIWVNDRLSPLFLVENFRLVFFSHPLSSLTSLLFMFKLCS